ncbi:MAG: YbgC/FadM family acyl-CoA thioesterase [Parvibaculaceae bacterium]
MVLQGPNGIRRLASCCDIGKSEFSGAVYHANYLKFCERGRSDCLRLLDIHHHEMHRHETGERMGFVVRRMACEFLRPARIDDLLEVETRFRGMGGARLELAQKVVRQGEVLFEADVTVVLVDAAGRPRRFPKAMAETLKAF